MGKKLLPLLSIGLLSVTLVACGSTTTAPTTKPASTTPATTTTAPAADAVIDLEKLPFDFPAVKTDFKAGDTILAPTRSMIDESMKAAAGTTPMYIFYNATVVEPGDVVSRIKEVIDTVAIPNAVIVPIKAGQSAKKGDIVLTWWQSGSGMQRAIVTEGGTTPTVTYLDDKNGATEQLKADSFNVLSADWQVGTTLACKGSGGYDQVILINMAGDKVLTSGWAGAMAVHGKSECSPVPLKTSAKAGDTVYVAPFGTFEKATVTSVDATNGKVKAKYDFAGSSTEEDFSFGNILMSLPQ